MLTTVDTTLLGVFLAVARSGGSMERNVVECGNERWTYGDLDVVSTGLAIDMRKKYGAKPTIAIVTENHPYVLATIFATWKLGGIVAPLDHHVPRDILERMLNNISPTCVVVPSSEHNLQNIIKDLSLTCLLFNAIDTTITALSRRFLDQAAELSGSEYPLPTQDDIAFYLHTSSASSVSNVKSVPLTHKSIMSGSRGRLTWWEKTWPQHDYTHLRVLGWSPWSHIIGLSHDIGAATLLTAGCYVFAIIPSTYHTTSAGSSTSSGHLDVAGQLLETAMSGRTTAFAAVPWVLEGFKRTIETEEDTDRKGRMLDAVMSFKVFGSGGASTSPECLSWAENINLPLVLDLGMTEVGGPLFHATIGGAEGWSSSDCMLPDAELILIDEHGEQTPSEGELVVRSRFITTGYLHYDNRAFRADEAGYVTFQTGDIYGYTPEQRLVWRGRKEDYIQMNSGESLDPREVEAILNQCSVIARSCIVGNNFLKTSSQLVCALVEPVDDSSKSSDQVSAEITKAIASANRALAPPLRIGWTRVLVLNKGQNIPLTKKGAIFRKKLEELFGQQLSEFLNASGQAPAPQADERPPASSNKAQGRTKDQVAAAVTGVVTGILGISADILEANAQATFAELGMDSSMATKIVNELNKRLDMRLPLNTCHTHVDLVSLTNAIIADLGLEGQSADALPSIKIAPAQELKEEIVIVGEAVRLPGDINRTDAFWKALIDQRDDIMTPVPESRWDHASFYRSPTSTDPPGPCDITLTKAGFIDVAGFDHSFFGISSAEAFHVTPNIRLSLEIAFEALENANIPISKIKGSNMGVFVASGMDESYIKLLFADKGWGAYTRFYGTGVATSTACGRISYLLDVHGPSYTVDTACSSGLIVMDNAVQYLQSGQGESAIVCGANTHTWPGVLGFLSAQKMTSSNSRCATFTDVADGYVPTEAAAGLILKTKSAALRDGDTILGVIRSTDVRHDGRSQGLVAPNVKAQIAMQLALLEKAALAPSQIDFIEAHGTGTSLGDLIEIQGINDVFKASHSPEQPLVVGASKSCVGHAETVSGLIGVLKTLGSFSAGTVPGLVQLNADNMNPSLDCSVVPLHIPHETAVLKTDASRPLKGMILSNGFAGSIAGAILEAPSGDLVSPPAPHITENIPMMFVVSAKSQEALAQYLEDYLDFCLNSPASSFHSICYTSCIGREHYRYRFACVASNMQDLIARLEDRIQSSSKNASGGSARRVLFAFPGQGSQYQGMGSYLSKEFSGFRTILATAANKASALTGYPILPFLVDQTSSGSRSIDQSEIAQVCIFLFQFAVSVWLQALGIQAQAVMGHSLGEIAAAVIARTFTFEQGLQFVVERARILRADPEHPACMAAVAATEDKVTHYISKLGLKDHLVVAVYNAPEGHVVSGERKAVESLVSAVKMDGIRATKLNIDQGFHSPAIAPALPALKVWLDKHEPAFAGLEKSLFSTVKGKEIHKHEILNSEYWVDHAKNPVRFVQTAREVYKSSVDVIVDVGPQPTIWTNMQTPEFSAKSRLAVTGKRGKDQIMAMLAALSSLFEKGITVDFAQLFEQMSQKFTKTQLPTYPFQRLHNYPSYIPNRHSLLGVGPADKRQSAAAAVVNQPHFSADQALCDFLDEHRIEGRRVLPGAAMADFFARASKSKSVKVIKFHKPLILESPDKQVRAEIDEKGSYKLLQKADSICSGSLSSLPPPRSSKKVLQRAPEVIPLQMISKTQVYECFKNVLFGEQFHTVQQVRIWSDYADGDIQAESTGNPEHDRIRKLDACLHMFGAVASRLAPTIEDEEGAFLPTSLEDFTLHSNDLPSEFTCRYYLPLEVTRNARLLSVAFDVFSEKGELLVSCRRYSVAWVPVGVVIPEQQAPADPDSWLRNGWNTQQLTQNSSLATHKFDDLVYLGHDDSRLLGGLANSATNTVFVSLPGLSKAPKEHVGRGEIQTLSIGQMDTLPAMLGGRDTLIVLDVTRANSAPGEGDFSELYLQILNFMKFIMTCKFKISSFVALTSWSAPVDLYAEGVDLFSNSRAVSTSLVGAVLQGMLRVFRRERGLDRTAWCLDFPNIDTLPEDTLQTAVMNEIQARYRGSFADTFVSYRQESMRSDLSRFVPTLQRISKVVPRAPSGTAIIIGMGSIGSALAAALVSSGCSKVVFFGRRPESNSEISKELAALPAKAKDHCLYRQVDVCDFNSLKKALAEVNSQVGGIKNIIHTAAVVNDATITSTKPSSFEDVLRPKIIGSWNLHNASLELDLPLDSFVLFSSTNVLVGNPGQVAYVSANSFMDSLATYRHNSGLPATSLQLGAWESKLTDNIDMKESFAFLMKHREGIPMIIKAMMVPIPVQVVARMDKEKLSATPAYAKDPFFSLLLKSAPQSQPKSTEGHRLNKQDVAKVVLDELRAALELQPNEKLDMAEPLTSCGADSITFAQFKGRIMQELEVDVPMVYLADSYTINDMIHNILESYAASSDSEPVQDSSSTLSKASVKDAIVNMLRSALDLQPSEKLDLAEPLTACGGDSITFAQFKGQVLKDLEVDVPMVYLSDAFSISDMIANILETYGASSDAQPASHPSGKTTQSKASVTKRVVDMLRGALDLRPNENLDLAEPLTACGGDSITFAQFKGQVLKELEVDVPMVYLSDAFTINDMITNILESCGSLSDAESTQPSSRPQASKSGITNTVVKILRDALDLREAENLDINEPLTSCGGDSITFAQFKGQVLKELGVDVPMAYLSDSFTINDMITNILESCEA